MSTMHKQDSPAPTLDQVMSAIVGLEASRDELREMISSAIADAKREGAEQMQAAAFDACVTQANADRRFAKSERNAGAADCAADLTDLIRALPLPTGPRQAVRLAEDKFDAIRISEKSPWWSGDHWCCEDADWYPLLRAIETAVLAANGLETK